MDTYTECKHGEVHDEAFACTPCALESGRIQRMHDLGDLEPNPRAEARFTGRCPGCDGWIAEGDTIVRIEGEWCCSDCGDDA